MKKQLCACGCGKLTNLAKYTDLRYGAIKGQPYRFLHGHGGGRSGHSPLNRIGRRYGQLVINKYAGSKSFGTQGRSHVLWECLCDCGNLCVRSASQLPKIKSCGCRKNALGEKAPNFKHGYAQRAEYRAYRNAMERCRNPKNDSYHDYGGRGIQFLYESFEQFLSDIGDKPSPNHSLDRKQVNGHYEPGNCRWSTRSDQCKNQRPVFAIENFTDEQLLSELRRRNLLKLFLHS